MVNKNNSNNNNNSSLWPMAADNKNNSSNSLVFGRWPQTKSKSREQQLRNTPISRQLFNVNLLSYAESSSTWQSTHFYKKWNFFRVLKICLKEVKRSVLFEPSITATDPSRILGESAMTFVRMLNSRMANRPKLDLANGDEAVYKFGGQAS